MSSWKGKTRGGVLGYKIFVWTVKNFGLSFAYFLLLFVVAYFIFSSRKAFRSIYYYFHSVLNYSTFRSLKSIYLNYYYFGQVILDKISLLTGLKTSSLSILKVKSIFVRWIKVAC